MKKNCVKLGSICTFQSGGTPSRGKAEYYNGHIPWITTVALNGGYIDQNSAVEWITDEAIRNSAAKIVPAYSMMVGTRVGIGKASINRVAMATSQDVISLLDIDDKVWSKEYLLWFIRGKSAYLQSQSRGATIKGVNIETVSALDVPKLPIEEQKELAGILKRAENLMIQRRKQLAAFDTLIKARFVELFGDLKTNPKRWPILSFPAFAKIDGNMTTDYEKYADYPHIGIDSIEKGTGELKGYRTVREDGVISGKYIFTSQHIIYSKIRPNLNKVALPAFEGLCSADAYPILPNRKNCNRVFLATAMRSEYFLEYILQFSSRTNLPKVNRKEIAGFRMPLPPLPLQNQFAAFVEQIDKSKVVVQKALDEAQLLFDSLMQQYFG